MSEPETFFARWSRLKSESGSEEGGVDEKRAAEGLTNAETSSPPAVAPSSLPPIESIGADSDIRGFLQAGVPVELARAALRSTWTADPSIRDFIGIAESQWDFNDPAAIPGFGSLGARDCALAAQALTAAAERQLAAAPAESSQDADLERQGAETTGEEPAAQPDPSESPPRARRSHGGALPR